MTAMSHGYLPDEFLESLGKGVRAFPPNGGRAGRPPAQARSGLGDTATIPNARRKLSIEWNGK